MHQRVGVLIVLVTILAGGCSRAVGSGGDAGPATPTTGAATTAPATPAPPRPTATAAPSLDPEIAQAMKFRHDFGLRDDLAFVTASMTDPAASDLNFGLPLYPDEAAKLFADQADQEHTIIPIVQGYAMAHADEFGGVYIDRDQHPGVVTTLWTAHLAEHATTLAGLLGDHAVIVRQVRYSYAELDALRDTIEADFDWMEVIPARMQSLGVGIIENAIDLDVSSAEPTAVQQIADHYGLGDKLVVTSDGTGYVFIPWGTVQGKIRTTAGKIPGSLGDLSISDEYDPAIPGGCGGGDIGYGFRDDGTFEYPCQAGVRKLVVTGHDAKGRNVVVGRATVTVVSGKTVTVTIHLTRSP